MSLIAGVDEAGRGPLAGPVYAGAVILNPQKPILGLQDSKLLTEKKRDALFHEICEKANAWSFGRADVQEIDKINILQASLLAMQRAVKNLLIQPEEAWIDGNRCPILEMPSRAFIGGDSDIQVISAASIIAKVLRDREMMKLDEQFPEYGFKKHKGYGTAMHLDALKKYGPSEQHRFSFSPVRRAFEQQRKTKSMPIATQQ